MKEKKYRRFPDYELIEKDDIRTIPDFYDNLYPSFDNFVSHSIINAPKKPAKKREKKQNNEH
ncbi:MAG: hypothetical protein IJZ20_06505 [Clostridia bacterium]|nr:hypothetical protein [Clostridia bacterium]